MLTGVPDAVPVAGTHLSAPRIAQPISPLLPFSLEDIESTIWERFSRVAAMAPATPAILDDDGCLTFAELQHEAERLSMGVLRWTSGPEEPVGVLLSSGRWLAVAILAIARAGRVFLGLDPGYPPYRLRLMVADSGTSLLLCGDSTMALAGEIVEAHTQVRRVECASGMPDSEVEPPARIGPDTLVQLCYTSGSTGEPKGLVQNHRNRLLNALNLAQNPIVGFGDRMSALFSVGFNSCLGDYLGAALTGATLVPLNVRELGYRGVRDRILRHRVNVINWLSTGIRELTALAEEIPGVRAIQLFGEPLTVSDMQGIRQVFGVDCSVYNLFGTSETGLLCSFPVVEPLPASSPQVPIGKPLLGKEVVLLDASGAPVSPGEPGEIVARGRFVTPGYWRRPELTASRIRTLPDPAGREFRTGDLARIEANGCLVHLGRKDFQIKIRGSRIEPEEVEAHLRRIPGVHSAAIAARNHPRGETYLVAYLVSDRTGREAHAEIRRLLSQSLPAAMIPHLIVDPSELPRTPNGKLDRGALPDPDWQTAGSAGNSRDAGLESLVRALWEELLGVDRIHSSDDFFTLGGDSILAARLVNRLQAELRAPVDPVALFTTPTFEGYCGHLRERHPSWRGADAQHAA